MKQRILLIGGTRPNFIKIAPLYHRLKTESPYEILLCHTGQHYDYEMSGVFFDTLELPKPDYFLGVKGNSVAGIIGDSISKLDEVIAKGNFDLVIVFGDVNATVSGAITAAQHQVPVMHVEAGLRSFDRTMPEEINRVITDHVSDYLMVSEQSGIDNLTKEGVDSEKIHFVGNLMIECLLMFREKWENIQLDEMLEKQIHDTQFFLSTFHRPENVDRAETLEKVINLLDAVPSSVLNIFPLHPRTKARIIEFGFQDKLSSVKNLIMTPPLSYFEFIHLISKAKMVMTDSGGIQEETSFLNIPCLTFRKNTERPVTIEKGTNRLVSIDRYFDENQSKVEDLLRKDSSFGVHQNPISLWDDKTSKRIVDIIERELE